MLRRVHERVSMIKNEVEEGLKLGPLITNSSPPLTDQRHLGPERGQFAEPLAQDLRLLADRRLDWDIETFLVEKRRRAVQASMEGLCLLNSLAELSVN